MRAWLLAVVVLFATLLAPGGVLAAPTMGPRASLDERATPRRAMETFLRAAADGNLEHAAECLDLRGVPATRRPIEGPLLARDLAAVLERRLPVDLARLSDDPEGDAADGPGTDLVGTIALDQEAVPIVLTRSRAEGGAFVWQISRATVALIPALRADQAESWWLSRVPPVLVRLRFGGLAAFQWLGLLVATIASAWGARLLGALLTRALERLARRTQTAWDDAISGASGSLRIGLAALLMKAAFAPLELRGTAAVVTAFLTTTLLIVGVAVFLIRLVNTGADAVEARLPEDTIGELRTRGVRTQLVVTRRIASLLVGFLAVAVTLLQFEVVRSVGMSLLASAGIAGVVLGFAAQKSLGGIIAGIQISITQPIRIGDLVVMETETGIVEEITLTFVVVRLLDERRLIVPIARVLDQPFQNWTKVGATLLVLVTVQADPRVPVAKVREELVRLASAHTLWDKRECLLQVVEVTDRAVTLRATVSVARAEDMFVFRADLREGLLTYLQGLEGGLYLARPSPQELRPAT